MIKAWRVRLVGYAACRGELRNGYRILVVNQNGRSVPVIGTII
jgi:hypothetical protein